MPTHFSLLDVASIGIYLARTYAPETALGAEQTPKIPFFDRGTFEEVFELGP